MFQASASCLLRGNYMETSAATLLLLASASRLLRANYMETQATKRNRVTLKTSAEMSLLFSWLRDVRNSSFLE